MVVGEGEEGGRWWWWERKRRGSKGREGMEWGGSGISTAKLVHSEIHGGQECFADIKEVLKPANHQQCSISRKECKRCCPRQTTHQSAGSLVPAH